jgi:putative ABC transport system substrate-binding protein
MRRREFIALLGSAVGVCPLIARAQQPTMPVVGFLSPSGSATLRQQIAALKEGLKQSGYIEGQSVTLESRFGEGQFDRLPALASDLVRRRVSVIVASSSAGVRAAKQTTTTVPIVFSIGEDPVKLGFVASLNRPGGNITGVYQFTAGLEAKRLGLLHEMIPNAKTVAVLINPNYPAAEAQLRDVQEAASGLSIQLIVLRANAEKDFEPAFATLVQQKAGSLLVCGSPFFNVRRQQLAVRAARHAVPAIYEWRDYATAGGLMSYGTDLADAYHQAGVYAGRILKGEKPADLPVVQLAKFEFVINLSTAKALGIQVPPNLAARADEIIE